MAGEQLRVTEGKERGKLLSIDGDLLIGRSAPEDEGRLGGDPEISRRHARVSRGSGGQLAIEDLGSANGTFVNDEPVVAPRLLEVGDLVRVGKTILQVTAPTAAVQARPELVVTAGSARGRRLALEEELVIGRAAEGEGRLRDDLGLSRRHARFVCDESGRLTVEDLGSANGTFVNGERVVGSRALEVGDSVRLGSTTLQVTGAGSAPAEGATTPSTPPAEAPASPAPPAPPAAAPPAPPAPAPPPARPAPPLPPAAKRPSAPPARRSDRDLELPVGAVFAGCRVEAVINHGEMGVVYRAEELALQRPVALKLILPEYSSDDRFRERFRRESKIAAAIDHPNVIPVFDAGEEQGVLFIMMRLVDGTDLRRLIAEKGRLEPLRAARIVRQVGMALDAAHARGMLHRDVKPSNVLLSRRDHVYLSDFGLAKQAESRDALTRNQTIVARVEYIAPEQILNQRVDARADIYALGCLLYETLVGEPPFARWTGGPGALGHLDAPPPSPLELRSDLPRGFDEVVRRAMAKDPSERYPSAGDLGQAALEAAGGLRRARAESVVATGEAAPFAGDRVAPEPERAGTPPAPAIQVAAARRPDLLRWAIALAGLVLVAIGMVAALHGISTL